jgi:hypothetical protein
MTESFPRMFKFANQVRRRLLNLPQVEQSEIKETFESELGG